MQPASSDDDAGGTARSADRWGERLARRLGLPSAVAVVVGITIGSGIFRTPAAVAQRVDDAPLFLLAWVAGAVVALCGALTYAELAAAFPRSGGIYVYVREAFGPLPAFLFGWAELWIIRPGAFGAIGITAAAYTLRTLGLDPAAPVAGLPIAAEQLLGAVFIVLVAAVNWLGIERGAALQNLTTALKVGALLGLIGIGLGVARDAAPAHAGVFAERATVGLSPFLLALVAILWAYDGWGDLSFVAGEVRDPARNLPRALVLGTGGVVALYLAANLVYLRVLPMAEMQRAELVAADVAQLGLGALGVVLISAAIAVSTFGTLNGTMMTSPRIFYAMAEDGLFPRAVAHIHPTTRTPTTAIAVTAALGVVCVSVRTFTELAEQFVIGIWPFYALAVGAVFVLRRRRPELERPYRTWGYPLVPALFLVASLFLLGNYLVHEPRAFALDVGLILAGVPVFWIWKRRVGHAS